MKTDRQFIENIYAKKAVKTKKQRKIIVFTVTAVLLLSVTASAFILIPHTGKSPTDNNVVDLPDSSEQSKEASVIISEPYEESETPTVTLLTCPITENNVEAMEVVEVNDKFTISAPPESLFYKTLKEHENDNTQFLISITFDTLSTFTYKGKYLSDIFINTNTIDQFNDDVHVEFNDFVSGYTKWHSDGNYVSIILDLHNQAAAGDAEAAEKLIVYSKFSEEELYYHTVWKSDKSEAYIAEFMKQCDEFKDIWSAYRDYCHTTPTGIYEAEAERLSAEGYVIECITDNGRPSLIGKLTAKQILEYNKKEKFSYSCLWLTDPCENDTDTTVEIEMDE